MQKILDRAGLKYVQHYDIDGKPDFAFLSQKVALFCDSQFWHGYRWKESKNQIHSNKAFWIRKIQRNMARDAEVNSALVAKGWKVLRFWEHQIKDEPDTCLASIIESLNVGRSALANSRL